MENWLVPIISAIIGGLITSIPWAIDKFNLISYTSKTRFNFSGKWVGLSEFIPNAGLTSILNDEHFFKLEAEISQTGRKIKITEKITGIYDNQANPLPINSSREFDGNGEIVNDINLLFTLNEKTGLTCGTGYLVSDTWGKALSGFLIVRNINGNPVLVKIELVRDGNTPPTIEGRSSLLLRQSTGEQNELVKN